MFDRKDFFSAVILAVIMAFVSVPAESQTYRPTFDEGFRAMKMNAIPDLHYSFDDWLQYSPGVVMIGMKAAGYDSRSSWGRMLVSDAFSAAVMVAAVNGTKYTVRRLRPDGTSRNSFPSGHTATSFMMASYLHQEYGWRSPWISFAGYAAASATGISRIVNDRHWATDVIAGAVIGVASVRLGYFLADLIFKDKYIDPQYVSPAPGFEKDRKYYDAGLFFGKRFSGNDETVCGSVAGIDISIPVIPHFGAALRAEISSFFDDSGNGFNDYSYMAGGFWSMPVCRLLEVDTRILAGYSSPGNNMVTEKAGILGGFTSYAGAGIGLAVGENFKIKASAGYEAMRHTVRTPFLHSFVAGFSASFFL